MSAARWPFVGTAIVLGSLVFTAGAAAHWIPGYTVVDSNGTVTINVAAKLSSDEVLDPGSFGSHACCVVQGFASVFGVVFEALDGFAS